METRVQGTASKSGHKHDICRCEYSHCHGRRLRYCTPPWAHLGWQRGAPCPRHPNCRAVAAAYCRPCHPCEKRAAPQGRRHRRTASRSTWIANSRVRLVIDRSSHVAWAPRRARPYEEHGAQQGPGLLNTQCFHASASFLTSNVLQISVSATAASPLMSAGSLEEVQCLEGHTDRVWQVSWSPSGAYRRRW